MSSNLTHNTQSNNEASEKYKLLIDHIPLCIHEINRDFRISFMSEAGLKMLGLGKCRCRIRKRLFIFCAP